VTTAVYDTVTVPMGFPLFGGAGSEYGKSSGSGELSVMLVVVLGTPTVTLSAPDDETNFELDGVKLATIAWLPADVYGPASHEAVLV
jgi:hypothetical protein